jgi:O-antigen chain-terminating methyltransferase
MEMNFREIVGAQHADFTSALDRSRLDIQQRLWADMERVRADYDRLIHNELRMIRQRVSLLPPSAAAPPPGGLAAAAPAGDTIDWLSFSNRFRGSEEYVRKSFEHYVPLYAGCTEVLDIGCGRGEFLELLKRAGTPARGIDLSAESVAQCRGKGLEAEVADLFTHLAGLADAALDGIFCAQVIEHLPPERLPEMLRLCGAKLGRGGLLVLETPNPECLAIFATHFYLDPTHQRPVPPALVKYYLEEFGFGQIEVERLAPAVETMPSLATLPPEFREAFFGSLDYSVRARKLS